MGAVYLARTRGVGGFERLVVIKCALPSIADTPQQMLLAEARLAATLQHTNIVQVQDVDTDGSTVFLAMEYLHGQDARALLARSWGKHRPLPLDQAVSIALSVCAGLHYAHEKHDNEGQPLEIVHRDISPSNVFVTYDGSVKLIDFGIAKATTLPSETQLGTIKGKPGYMSPEQCRCEPLDRRNDIFCVGILLYELTTGKRCFAADNEYLIAKKIMEEPPPALPADYPRELAAILMRALAKDRGERFPTALAMQEELSAFAARMRLDVSQFAMMRLMSQLFAGELAAWHAAQKSGQSLVDHVIKRSTMTVEAVDPPTASTVHERPTPIDRPPRRRIAWLVALAIVIGGTAGGIAWWRAATPASATPPIQHSDAAPAALPDASPAIVGSDISPDASPPIDANPNAPDAAVPAQDAGPERRRPRRTKTEQPQLHLDDETNPDSIIR